MELFFREYKPAEQHSSAQTIVILHGLFGSSDNWLTQARLLSQLGYNVYTVDLPNHGLSPHTDTFDYPTMVDAFYVFATEKGLHDFVLIGHSMGGKTAMNVVMKYPELVSKLIVVDIAPRYYDLEHYVIVDGLNAIDVDTVTSRQEADDKLSAYVAEADVRQFLLKNLQRKPEGGFSWKINLPLISSQLKNIGVPVATTNPFDKPTLFIRGRRSAYVRDEDWIETKLIFPNASLETLETGHWVQAEKPQEFVELVDRWLKTTSA